MQRCFSFNVGNMDNAEISHHLCSVRARCDGTKHFSISTTSSDENDDDDVVNVVSSELFLDDTMETNISCRQFNRASSLHVVHE